MATRGKSFRAAVEAALTLEPHEQELLCQVERTLDMLDALDATITTAPLVLPDGRVAPAVIEHRQQSLTLARLLSSLRLPDDWGAQFLDRGQRRGGARGVYVPRERLEALRAKTS